MKSYKYWLIVFLSVLTLAVDAQQKNVEIRGTVLEQGTDEPLEQATIRLLNVKDSTLVKGMASSRSGTFSFPSVKPGNYLLHVSYIGYEPFYETLQISGKVNPVNVGKIHLSDSGILLGEAVVTGKAPEMVVKNDTVEYNADSYKVAEGSVLEDLLKKMPGVEVGTDGKITVNGKEVKKMLIDGKEFFSDDPKVASKNLPTKMIDKVQVLDRKSDMAQLTGFDDGDEETVINLTVKPGMKQGWFGNAFAGYGSKDRYEANAMVNRFINNDQLTMMGGANNTNNMGFTDLASTMFEGMSGMRRGRRGGGGAGNGITQSGNGGINFSKEFNPGVILGGNARYAHSDNEADSKSNTQNILSGNESSYSNEVNYNRTKSDNVGANFRMEWAPDTLTKIIFTPNISYNRNHSLETSEFNTLDNAMDTVNVGSSEYLSRGEGYNLSGTLDFSRKLNSLGRVFSASVSGGYNDSYNQGMNFSDTRYYQLDGANRDELIDQRFRYDNKGYNYRLFLSWVEPIGHNNFIQATYSLNQKKQESLKSTFIKDENEAYTVLDADYSKSYRNTFLNQRASLSFKSQRQKYNYTLGFNVDPSSSKSTNFVGDSTLNVLTRQVVNFSPMAQFNYRFDKRSNLRIDYNGRTTQPTMTQLQPVADISDPLNTIIGNPDLKPTYTNNLSLRYQKFSPEKQQAFMVRASGSYVLNDIVSKTEYNTTSGKKESSYTNVNGNWDANIRAIFNTPLKNRRFSIHSMTMFAYGSSNGYVNSDKNTSKNLQFSERAGIDFRSDYIDLGVSGSIRYNGVNNSLQGQDDRNTWNYTAGGNTTIYLPLNFRVESDINYSANSGYAAGYQQKEVLWNASLAKQFLKNNQGTIRIKMYDMLHQRSNISRTITANYIQDTEYNTLSSYFMVHFIYRFSIFKGTDKAPGMGPGHGPRGGEGTGGRPF